MDDTLQERTERFLAQLWEKHRDLINERMRLLQQAKAEMLGPGLSPEMRTRAAGEAHKLAGSLGTFGLQRGTEAAREISHLLQPSEGLKPEQAQHIGSLIDQLAAVIESGRGASAAGS